MTKDTEALTVEGSIQEMAKEFDSFIHSVDEQQGEMNTADQAASTEAIQPWVGGPPEKRDRVALFIHRLESEAGYEKAEGDRRLARGKRFKRLSERLRFGIKSYMEMEGIVKAEGNSTSFAVRKNPPSVNVVRPHDLPIEFCRMKPEPDKTKIKEALKRGEEVTGAILVTDSTRLEIS